MKNQPTLETKPAPVYRQYYWPVAGAMQDGDALPANPPVYCEARGDECNAADCCRGDK